MRLSRAHSIHGFKAAAVFWRSILWKASTMSRASTSAPRSIVAIIIVSVFEGASLLVAIVKKCLALPASLYEILQILSLTLFEKTQVNCLFDDGPGQNSLVSDSNQLYLFN